MAPDGMFPAIALTALILCGAYFAAAETAYSSTNVIRLKNLAEDGNRDAKRVMYIFKYYDRALTTILICTNVIHIICATLATLIAVRFWGERSVLLSTIVTAVIVFFVAEMLPKSIAQAHSEQLAMGLSGSLRFIMRLLYPVCLVFSSIGSLAKKIIGTEFSPSVTEDELYEIIETINDGGGMSAGSGELIRSAIEFDRVSVRNVLTPRVDTVMIDIDISEDELLHLLRTEKHSRLPVYEDSVDNIIGVLLVMRYLKLWAKGGAPPPLREMLDKPLFVPSTAKIDELLSQMRSHKHHMAIVSDDYGGVMGIVTLEDILEELVGDIWDEDDEVVEEYRPAGRGGFYVSGDMYAADALELLGIPEQEREGLGLKTMRAWALEHFDTMPKPGESFNYGTASVEIKTCSGFRIDRLLLRSADKVEVGG